MFVCGWLPPTLPTACGLITEFPGNAVFQFVFPVLAQLLPAGVPKVAFRLAPTTAMLAVRGCVCVGIVCWVMVTAEEPAASPKVWPAPSWIGALPRKLGRAKLVCPLPPYTVPNKENKAWF